MYPNKGLEQLKAFPAKYSPQAISASDAQALKAILTEMEHEESLKVMKHGEIPGPDGLTVQCYKSFCQSLAPCFLSGFISLIDFTPSSNSLLKVPIALHPKEGKNPTRGG